MRLALLSLLLLTANAFSAVTLVDTTLDGLFVCSDNTVQESEADCPGQAGGGPVTGGSNGGWPEPTFAQAAGTSTRGAIAYNKAEYVLQNHCSAFNLHAWNDQIGYQNTSIANPPNRMVPFRVGAVGAANEGVLGTTEFSSWQITQLPADSNVKVYESDGTEVTTVPTSMGDNHGYVCGANDYTGVDSFRYRAVDVTGTSTEAVTVIEIQTTANYPMPAGFPATLDTFWGTTETANFPTDWSSEVAGYVYIDGTDVNCSDAVTWGSETVPFCSYQAAFPHNATSAAIGAKVTPLAGGACYDLPNQGTIRSTWSAGTEAAPVIIEGQPDQPFSSQACLQTNSGRAGTSVYGINGSNIIFSGISLKNVRVEPRHAKEDGISDDGITFRHMACQDIQTAAGNCIAPASGSTVRLERSGAFNIAARNNGERDPTLAAEQDVHGTALGNNNNGYLLDVVCSANGGDCFQATQNNNNGKLWIGRIDSHSDSENCIDIKAHEDYLVSQPYCVDYRVIIYDSSTGNGNAIVQNDDDAADQSGYGRIINGFIYDVNGPGIESSIQATKQTIYGNVIGKALGTGAACIRVRNAKAGSDITVAFNTFSDCERGIHAQTSGSPTDIGVAKFFGNYLEGQNYNVWMLNTSNYEVFDRNYYEDTAAAALFQCCSNSNAVDRTGLSAWQAATSGLSTNAVMEQDGNFRLYGPSDRKPLSGSDLIAAFETTEITALDSTLIPDLQADLGTEVTDLYGQARGTSWAAGAIESDAASVFAGGVEAAVASIGVGGGTVYGPSQSPSAALQDQVQINALNQYLWRVKAGSLDSRITLTELDGGDYSVSVQAGTPAGTYPFVVELFDVAGLTTEELPAAPYRAMEVQ